MGKITQLNIRVGGTYEWINHSFREGDNFNCSVLRFLQMRICLFQISCVSVYHQACTCRKGFITMHPYQRHDRKWWQFCEEMADRHIAQPLTQTRISDREESMSSSSNVSLEVSDFKPNHLSVCPSVQLPVFLSVSLFVTLHPVRVDTLLSRHLLSHRNCLLQPSCLVPYTQLHNFELAWSRQFSLQYE